MPRETINDALVDVGDRNLGQRQPVREVDRQCELRDLGRVERRQAEDRQPARGSSDHPAIHERRDRREQDEHEEDDRDDQARHREVPQHPVGEVGDLGVLGDVRQRGHQERHRTLSVVPLERVEPLHPLGRVGLSGEAVYRVGREQGHTAHGDAALEGTQVLRSHGAVPTVTRGRPARSGSVRASRSSPATSAV